MSTLMSQVSAARAAGSLARSRWSRAKSGSLNEKHEGRGLRRREALPGSRLGDRGEAIAHPLPRGALDIARIAGGQSTLERLEHRPRLVFQLGLLHQIGPRGNRDHLRLHPVLKDFSLVLLDQLRGSTGHWHALLPLWGRRQPSAWADVKGRSPGLRMGRGSERGFGRSIPRRETPSTLRAKRLRGRTAVTFPRSGVTGFRRSDAHGIPWPGPYWGSTGPFVSPFVTPAGAVGGTHPPAVRPAFGYPITCGQRQRNGRATERQR